MQKFTVNTDDAEIRLDRWFKRHQPNMPHSLLQKMLRKGQVRVNGKKRETNYRLTNGDEISMNIGEQESRIIKEVRNDKKISADFKAAKRPGQTKEQLEKEFHNMVLFENNDYVVINKPHGLASQGGRGIDVSVDDMLKAVSDRYKLVHRLDKDTSGVLVIAKKTTAATKFSELLKAKAITKIYWALVRNAPPKQKGTIKLSLIKRGDKMEKVEVDEEAEGAKRALTEYTILERMAGALSWLELSPITGRTHQLRVHCSAIGCPIIGDGKYGGAQAFEKGLDNKLHLHARRIVIRELGIDVTAALPSHMKKIAPNI